MDERTSHPEEEWCGGPQEEGFTKEKKKIFFGGG